MSAFVDEAQLNVRGGDGGAGCVSFRREGPVAMGGPNGGDGGKGGDVWLVADRNVASLLAFRDHPHRRAGNGVHGKGKDLHGRRGEDMEIHVPEGTVARDMYSGEILADLVNHGDRWLAATGGRGGRGNAKFLNNKRRAPSFAEQGEEGAERWLALELTEGRNRRDACRTGGRPFGLGARAGGSRCRRSRSPGSGRPLGDGRLHEAHLPEREQQGGHACETGDAGTGHQVTP